jgi:hypothetical protein
LDGWRHCLARAAWLTVELLTETGLVVVDLTLDREQRRAARVPVTVLGRRALCQARGGPGAGEPVLQLRIELVDSEDPSSGVRCSSRREKRWPDLHAVIQATMG